MKTGDHVQWCFSSLDKNIEFSVLFISKDQFVQTVVPLCFVESKSSLITGEWECINDGCVRLVFDNSKSSWYSCSVSYEVTIEEPAAALFMCYKFSTGDVLALEYAFRVATIEGSDLDRVINRVPTTASFLGPKAGDRIAIVASGEACDSTEYQFTLTESLQISATIVFPGLLPSYVDVCYAVNSKWLSMFTVPLIGLSNIVPESVVANYEYSFYVNATHISGEGDSVKVLRCGHSFHSDCIDPWLINEKALCPVCRRGIFQVEDWVCFAEVIVRIRIFLRRIRAVILT